MIEVIEPIDLFSYKRCDLVVRYLYIKEYMESFNNDYNKNIYKDLYSRMVIMRTMANEPARPYENSKKDTIEKHINAFNSLIESIKKDGFNKNNPVHANIKNAQIENGAHRIATSAYFKEKITVDDSFVGAYWGFEWFVDNGFSTEDKQRILKGFIDIHPKNCAIFVVWNPLFKYIDNIKAVLSKYFDIVGDVELDFEDNYIAFTNSILEIYEPNISQNGCENTILEKAKLLQNSYLSYKVIVVTNQRKNSDKEISELSKTCKEDIRQIFDHIIPKEVFCTCHCSDGESECRYLASILLSPNNIKHLKMRNTTEPGVNFVRRIRNLPSFLTTLEIFDKNDICVIGSGVMTALGVQKDSDSDFIIDYKHRDRLGWGIIYLNDDYDIGISDKLAQRPITLPDNVLIHNDEYHFWFKGIKFANLEIIKDRKRISQREKDIVHLRQIELYEKLMGNINQQKILMERIDAEKQRRLEEKQRRLEEKQKVEVNNIIKEEPANNENVDIQQESNFNQQEEIISQKIKYKNLLEKIFSVKNEILNNKKRKVITICGIKAKIKC